MTTSLKDWEVILLVVKQRLSKFFKATQQVSVWIYNSHICLLLSPAGHADSLWNAYFQQTPKGQEESKRIKGTDKVSINSKKQMFSAIQKTGVTFCLSCYTSPSR